MTAAEMRAVVWKCKGNKREMRDFDRHGKKGNSQKTRSTMANLQVMGAIQLIPEFDVSLDSLEQFLMLIDYYADQNPEGAGNFSMFKVQ